MTSEGRLPSSTQPPIANSRGQMMLEETIDEDANTQGDKTISFQAFLASEFYKGFGVGSDVGQSDSKTSGVECLDDIRFPMDSSYLLDFQSPSKARKGDQALQTLDKDLLYPLVKPGMVSASIKEEMGHSTYQHTSSQKLAEQVSAANTTRNNGPGSALVTEGGAKPQDNPNFGLNASIAVQPPPLDEDPEEGSGEEEHSADSQAQDERKIGPNTTLFSGSIKFLDPKKAIPEETSVSAAVLDYLQTDITLCFGEVISAHSLSEIWTQVTRGASKAVQGFVLTDVKKNRALFDVKSQVARAQSTKTAEGKSGRDEQTSPGSLVFKCDAGTQVSLFATERNLQIQLYLFSKDNPQLPPELRGLPVPGNHEFCWLLVYQ